MLEGAKSIGVGAATIALAGAAIGIGNLFGSLIHAIARNPSLAKKLFRYAILGFSLTEAIALFALMMAFLILLFLMLFIVIVFPFVFILILPILILDEQSPTFDNYTIPEDDLELGKLRFLEVDFRMVVPAKTHLRNIVTSTDALQSWVVPSYTTANTTNMDLELWLGPGRVAQPNSELPLGRGVSSSDPDQPLPADPSHLLMADEEKRLELDNRLKIHSSFAKKPFGSSMHEAVVDTQMDIEKKLEEALLSDSFS